MNSGPNGEWFVTSPEFWSRITEPIIAWKLWYADGSTINSMQSTWDDAPSEGVQVLMVYHPSGHRNIIKGRDEYCLPSSAIGKLGLAIDLEEFHAIMALAMADEWRP
jgi:hypothetical protein